MTTTTIQPERQVATVTATRDYLLHALAHALILDSPVTEARNEVEPVLALDYDECRIDVTAYDLVDVLADLHDTETPDYDLPTIPAGR